MGVIRVREMLRDPIYGQYVRRAFDRSAREPNSLVDVLANAEEIDGACDVRPKTRVDDFSCTLILYGESMNPANVVDDGAPAFTAKTTLASGVTEWSIPAHGGDAWTLFVARDAWVFAHAGASERTRASLAESASPPPRLDLEPGALVAVALRASALDARDFDRESLNGTERVIVNALDTGEMLVTPSAKGDVVSRFWLTDEDSAKILEGEMLATTKPDARCDSTCKLVRAIAASVLHVDRSGTFVSVRLHLPESVLKRLL